MNETVFVNDLEPGDQLPWASLEFRVKRGQVHEWRGWRAGITRELLIRQAAMTLEGAQRFAEIKGTIINNKEVKQLLEDLRAKGFVRTFKETDIKSKKKLTRYIRSQDNWDTIEVIHVPEGHTVKLLEVA